MKKRGENNIILKAETGVGMRVFAIIAGTLAFCAFFLTLFSGADESTEGLLAVLVGLPFAVVFLSLPKKKWVKLALLSAALLYTVLIVSIGFSAFFNGFLSFLNSAAHAANNNMHWGFRSYAAEQSAISDFLFCSVVSVWLALGVAFLGERNKVALLLVSALVTAIWVCLGLFPAAYALILLAAAQVGLFIAHNAFPAKAALVYVALAAVVFGAVCPVFLYGGNGVVTTARENVSAAFERLFYGRNVLPEGKLKYAGGLLSSDDERLRVTLTRDTPKLYLKGFVGGDLENDKWKTTDKNAYVQNNYQGLLDYVASEGLPFMQYARYSALCGSRSSYRVTVENVSASRKYVYTPYGLSERAAGTQYYDLNLRGNLFTPRAYTFSVFGGDESSERVSQADWLFNGALRSDEMNEYMEIEGEYRSFIYNVYNGISEETRSLIEGAHGWVATSSINTATQLIRDYFNVNFEYAQTPDRIEGDFLSDFFGGKIKKGNAVYFATAATYLFRYYGFAARYAEGYLVDEEFEGESATLSVTGKDAHAWTEVYFDGIGWLPIEVTPGFYSDKIVDPDDPDNPDKPDPPVDPDPPDNPDDPDKPNPPVVDPPLPPTKEETQRQNLLIALKVLVPVSAVALAVALSALSLTVARSVIVKKRRGALENAHGGEFGRAAGAMIARDCRSFGGFSEQTLEKFGVPRERTARFIELCERSVYGGYELTLNEKSFVTAYLESAAEALMQGNFAHRFVCKYIKFIGIS